MNYKESVELAVQALFEKRRRVLDNAQEQAADLDAAIREFQAMVRNDTIRLADAPVQQEEQK